MFAFSLEYKLVFVLLWPVICRVCRMKWFDVVHKFMILYVLSVLNFEWVFFYIQMQREAEERIFKASSCEQEAYGYEQAFDGREW